MHVISGGSKPTTQISLLADNIITEKPKMEVEGTKNNNKKELYNFQDV